MDGRNNAGGVNLRRRLVWGKFGKDGSVFRIVVAIMADVPGRDQNGDEEERKISQTDKDVMHQFKLPRISATAVSEPFIFLVSST